MGSHRVLGPQFFQLYIEDIVNLPLYGRIILYADDAVVYAAGKDLDSVVNNMQSDLI